MSDAKAQKVRREIFALLQTLEKHEGERYVLLRRRSIEDVPGGWHKGIHKRRADTLLAEADAEAAKYA